MMSEKKSVSSLQFRRPPADLDIFPDYSET